MIKFLVFMLIPLSTIKAQTYTQWNNTKLNYSNFKKTPQQTKTPQGFLDSRLGWQITEGKGLPELIVYNKFNENNSWISMKHEEVLKNMQLQLDLSELYARKIRKEFEILRNNGEKQREVYRTKFSSLQKTFQKRLNKIANTTVNQPDLYKIINNQIQDSIKMYKSYEVINK